MLLTLFVGLSNRQAKGASSPENAVVYWDRVATEAAQANGLINFPIVESRIYAMTSLAVHDALNAIDRRYRSYALRLHGVVNSSPEAAVATAAHQVLVDQFGRLPAVFGLPSQRPSLDAAYAQALAQIPDGGEKSAGIFIGYAAAASILAVRANDGWESQIYPDTGYVQGTLPGQYRFTEGFAFAFAPGWGEMKPFALRSGRQFRPGPPYVLGGHRYAQDVNEIKALGGNGTTTPSARTADETEIARFWYEDAPLQWNRIARSLAGSKHLDAWQSARLFGWLNVAQADGYISSFDAKYYFRFWRPETAIHLADDDGNPDTTADPAWTPLLPTPPVPDHDSAHAVEGAAAAEVFIRFFGDDRTSFATCSTTLLTGQNCGDPGAVYRSFSRFSEAAKENGRSRVLVGIHFSHAVSEGLEHGTRIGVWTADHILATAHRDHFDSNEADETPDVDR
jgi:hypothetical protein